MARHISNFVVFTILSFTVVTATDTPKVCPELQHIESQFQQVKNGIKSSAEAPLNTQGFDKIYQDAKPIINDAIKAAIPLIETLRGKYLKSKEFGEKQAIVYNALKKSIENNPPENTCKLLQDVEMQKFILHNSFPYESIFDLACNRGQVLVVKELIKIVTKNNMWHIAEIITLERLLRTVKKKHYDLLRYFIELSNLQNIYKSVTAYLCYFIPYTKYEKVSYPAHELAIDEDYYDETGINRLNPYNYNANGDVTVMNILKPYIDQEKKTWYRNVVAPIAIAGAVVIGTTKLAFNQIISNIPNTTTWIR